MKLIEKLMDIDLIINDNGGLNFLKIREYFDDFEEKAAAGNLKAIQFSNELDNIYRVIKLIVEKDCE